MEHRVGLESTKSNSTYYPKLQQVVAAMPPGRYGCEEGEKPEVAVRQLSQQGLVGGSKRDAGVVVDEIGHHPAVE